MIRVLRLVAAAALLPPSALLPGAQQSGPAGTSAIASREIDGRLRFLSHDLLEFRALRSLIP